MIKLHEEGSDQKDVWKKWKPHVREKFIKEKGRGSDLNLYYYDLLLFLYIF
jgi:hypothetical protein